MRQHHTGGVSDTASMSVIHDVIASVRRCRVRLDLLILLVFLSGSHASAQVSTTPLFFADQENGRCERSSLFDEWKDGRTGGLSSDLHAEVFASSRIARSGNCAIGIRMTGMSVDGHPRAGAFVYLSNLNYPRGDRPAVPLPDGYYSAWYYLPVAYRAEHMWNVFQFMNRLRREDVAGERIADFISGSSTVERMLNAQILVEGEPEISVKHVDYLTNPRQRASESLSLRDAENVSCFSVRADCYRTPDNGRISGAYGSFDPVTNVRLPVGRWFQIEAFIRESTNTADGSRVNLDGQFRMWLDGQKIIDRDAIQTRLHPAASLHWEINSYSNYGVMSEDTVDLYLDDAMIRPYDPAIADEQAKSGPKDCSGSTPVLSQQAETGSLAAGYRVLPESGASGGYVVVVPDSLSAQGGSIRHCFNIAESATYRLQGLPTGDQVEVRVNGVISADTFYMERGRHELTLTHKWGRARVDQLELIRDSVPAGQLSVSDAAIAESADFVRVEVRLSTPQQSRVSTLLHSRDGSAESGKDFYGFTQELIFAPGEVLKNYDIQILDDFREEAEESFEVRLTRPDGAVIRDDTGVVVINDDDRGNLRPLLSVADASFDENSTETFVELNLDRPVDRAVGVTVFTRPTGSATPGSDYYGFTRSVEIPAGQTRVQVAVELLNDTRVESTDTFQVWLIDAREASIDDGVATISIRDDD